MPLKHGIVLQLGAAATKAAQRSDNGGGGERGEARSRGDSGDVVDFAVGVGIMAASSEPEWVNGASGALAPGGPLGG